MVFTLRSDLDPLDLELIERAVQGVSDAIRTGSPPVGVEADEELELKLRRELAGMVRAGGVSDPDALMDLLIEAMRAKICRAWL